MSAEQHRGTRLRGRGREWAGRRPRGSLTRVSRHSTRLGGRRGAWRERGQAGGTRGHTSKLRCAVIRAELQAVNKGLGRGGWGVKGVGGALGLGGKERRAGESCGGCGGAGRRQRRHPRGPEGRAETQRAPLPGGSLGRPGSCQALPGLQRVLMVVASHVPEAHAQEVESRPSRLGELAVHWAAAWWGTRGGRHGVGVVF